MTVKSAHPKICCQAVTRWGVQLNELDVSEGLVSKDVQQSCLCKPFSLASLKVVHLNPYPSTKMALMFPATSYIYSLFPGWLPHCSQKSFLFQKWWILVKVAQSSSFYILRKKLWGFLFLMVSSINAPKHRYGYPCINCSESCHWKLGTGNSQKARLPSDHPSWRLLGLRWKRRRAGHVPLYAPGPLPCPSSHKTTS